MGYTEKQLYEMHHTAEECPYLGNIESGVVRDQKLWHIATFRGALNKHQKADIRKLLNELVYYL